MLSITNMTDDYCIIVARSSPKGLQSSRRKVVSRKQRELYIGKNNIINQDWA